MSTDTGDGDGDGDGETRESIRARHREAAEDVVPETGVFVDGQFETGQPRRLCRQGYALGGDCATGRSRERRVGRRDRPTDRSPRTSYRRPSE